MSGNLSQGGGSAPNKSPQQRVTSWAMSIAVTLLGLVLLGALFAPDQSKHGGRPTTGDEAIFDSQSGVNVLVAISQGSHDRMIQLAVANDHLGLAQMASANIVFLVKPGTACRVIDSGLLTSEVRITAGPHFGKSCFVAAEHLRRK